MIYLLAIIKEVETKQDYDNDLIRQSRQILNVCPEKRNIVLEIGLVRSFK